MTAKRVDDEALARAKLHLLDWIGCASAGTAECGAVSFRSLNAAAGSGSCFTMYGNRRDENAAAFANGALGNLLEMDDTDRQGLVHPGDVVIPPVLACAETEGVGGREVLAAIVRGYEVMIRIARAVGLAHYGYWHNTATCGPFGAAAGVATILDLDPLKTAYALGHAGSLAGGLWQLRHEETVTKQLHTAHAARHGLTAARVAAAGGEGPLSILEGSQGFFAAMCPDGDVRAVCQDAEAPWRIFETTFKPWPSCRHCHVSIEAALALGERFVAERIARVSIRTFGDALKFCDRAEPENAGQARFSIQHSVAVALLRGEPRLADFEPDAISDPAIAALRRKVDLDFSGDCDQRYPAHMSATIEIEAQDGRIERCEIVDALGDPERPLDVEGLVNKAGTLMRRGRFSANAIDTVVDILGDDTIDFDLERLTGALCDGSAAS
ncbi:MmgE/PrpD family protein [Oricola thermophila]|nr:MmgE/PrpD family protein [Oricola thermophila]